MPRERSPDEEVPGDAQFGMTLSKHPKRPARQVVCLLSFFGTPASSPLSIVVVVLLLAILRLTKLVLLQCLERKEGRACLLDGKFRSEWWEEETQIRGSGQGKKIV